MTTPSNDPVLQAFSALFGKMVTETPELVAIMDEAKSGKITEVEAMTQLMALIRSRPDLEHKFTAAAHQTLAPLCGPEASLPVPGDTTGLIMPSPHGGLPRLNPLYEAALLERLQFDGDIPELRYGPLPPGVNAAVSVNTKAHNPAAIGKMLKDASEQVTAQVKEHQADRAKMIEGVITGDPKALEVIKKHGELIATSGDTVDVAAMNRGSKDTDLDVYRRGEVPKPVKVKEPEGMALAAMTEEEKREGTWRFLSTTQGRRTALTVVREMIVAELKKHKWDVTEREFDLKAEKEEPLAKHEWRVQIDGAGSMQASFSFIDTAARILAAGLLGKLDKISQVPVYLEVITMDTVDVRKVGWAARVIRKR